MGLTDEPTEKQIALALKLGIQDPQTFSKQALKEVISRKIDSQKGHSDMTSPQTYKATADKALSGIDKRENSKQAGVAMRYAVDLCIAGKIQVVEIPKMAADLLEEMNKLANSLD